MVRVLCKILCWDLGDPLWSNTRNELVTSLDCKVEGFCNAFRLILDRGWLLFGKYVTWGRKTKIQVKLSKKHPKLFWCPCKKEFVCPRLQYHCRCLFPKRQPDCPMKHIYQRSTKSWSQEVNLVQHSYGSRHFPSAYIPRESRPLLLILIVKPVDMNSHF